jgi:hypothetical protein
MSKLFASNIGKSGRIFRGSLAALLLLAGLYAVTELWWLGLILLSSGGFALFEALRGWCIMRACGIKTRL